MLTPKTIDVLLQLLEDRIRSLRATPPSNQALRNVYVLCDPTSSADWEAALQLKSCLEAERRFAAMLTIREVDDERNRLKHIREALSWHDAALVYWGSAKESWFVDKFSELIKARVKRRKKQLPALCLSSRPHEAWDHLRRPDVPFEQIPDVRCDLVRPLLRHLDPVPNGGST